MTVSVPPRLDLQSQSRPPGRAFARPGRPGRTWQRRSVPTPPFFRPTRYPPSPTLPPAPRLPAARAQARALAHRISVCALSSEAPITPGIHGRRGVPPEARIEAPAPSTRRDPRHHQPLPGNTASAFPLIALRIPQIPQGDAFLPGGQLERPLSWLGRARLPAHLRVLTATTPTAVLSPPRATRIRSRTACNRRAAPLPSIVGAGIEDPCAICPEICGVTRLEPYVDSSRGGTSGRRLIQPYLVVCALRSVVSLSTSM